MSDEIEQELKALAAEYALGLLSPAEARAFEDLLSTDPDLRDAYAEWVEDFVTLTDGIAPQTPPASVEKAIEAQLFPQSKTVSGWRARLGLLPAALTGAVLAAVVLVAFDFGPKGPDFEPELVATLGGDGDSLRVAASFDAETSVLRVDRAAGTAADGRSFELWLIVGDNLPVSLGVLPDAAVAEFVLPAQLASGAILAISDEPLGGSPTGQPTGDVLAAGALTPV